MHRFLKPKRAVFFIIPLLVIGILSFRYAASDKDKILIEAITQTIEHEHVSPKQIDDKFSEKVFNGFLKQLDYQHHFFTQEDIAQFAKYKYSIDDQIQSKTFEFFDMVNSRYEERVKQAQQIYREILSKPFEFETDEKLVYESEKTPFPKDDADLKEVWRKALKYQVLMRVAEDLDTQEKSLAKKNNPSKQENDPKGSAHKLVKDKLQIESPEDGDQDDKTDVKKDTIVKQKSLAELEQAAREKLLKTHNDWFTRLLKSNKTDRENLYFNAIAGEFDPHTEYFPPSEKEDFDIKMSGSFFGIGATLQEKEDGYIQVSDIIRGSASWKQGDLKIGDKILKVAQGKKEPVDIIGMRLDSAVRLIRGPKGTEVRLTVKKKDGNIAVIPIIRDIVIIEETFAKSAIIEGSKNETPYGYIYLPKFYFKEESRGRSCADDIERELKKLQEEKVGGVVLDLRNNGGGSLQDVVKMAGLFIEKGPIVQVKSKEREPELLNDYNPSITYKGPLVVLVNEFSASASEIFAAAMQDYKRGIIIGSTSTYGKGTVQRFYNFDDMVNAQLASMKPLGALKLTIQKFYRINGEATQLKGVVPDIILPDGLSYIKFGEKEEESALQHDMISPAKYNTWKTNYDADKIVKQSKKRLEKNDYFSLVNEEAKRVKSNKDEQVIPLKLSKYRAMVNEEREKNKKFENLGKTETGMKLGATKFDLPDLKSDSSKLQRNEHWLKELQKDQYLLEAVKVLKDMK